MSKEEVSGLWLRAKKAIQTARDLQDKDTDASASRAYYAAFYAVSALFILRGQSFSKHSAVETAVHRDLVKAGYWDRTLGADFSSLLGTRATSDYGVLEHISDEDSAKAIKAAERILKAAHELYSEDLPWNEED